jgi:DNA-directed RNA polymerase specialized sigma24 family protein
MAAQRAQRGIAERALEAQGIHSREIEYRRRAHALLRDQFRGYFFGAGLGECDREGVVCEVVDDVLVAEAAGRVRGESRAARFAYLKMALWRRLRAEWRRRERHPVRVADPHGAVLERVASEDTAEIALNRCALALIAAAMEQALDEREREVARVFLVEQRSEREGARELGIGRAAAAARAERVRRKLRAYLAARGITCTEEAWCS